MENIDFTISIVESIAATWLALFSSRVLLRVFDEMPGAVGSGEVLPAPAARSGRGFGESMMSAEGKLDGLALRIVAQLKDAMDKAAQGSAQVFNKFSDAGRDAARVFEHESYLAEQQLKIDLGYGAVDADGRTYADRALSDFMQELAMRSRLRGLERRQWELSQRLERRPGDKLLAMRLDRVDREHRQLDTEIADSLAARSTWGTQPWKVDNSPQSIRELRDRENVRQRARDGVEDLKLRRDDLKLRRDDLRAELRGESTRAGRSVEGRGGDPESRAAARSRWQALETPYDDSTVAGLRDLKGAQQNVEWMTGQLARQEKALEAEIGKLERGIERTENELAKDRARLEQESRQPQPVLVAYEGPVGPPDARGNPRADAQEGHKPGRAEKAQERVNEAAEEAKRARERVGEAKEKAKEAQEKADNVKEEGQKQRKVDSAQSRADRAEEQVIRAQEKADQAKEKLARAEDKVEKAKEKDKAAADRAEEKDRKRQGKEQEKAEKNERKEKEQAEAKEKRAAHLRSAGLAGAGIAAGAAAAFGVSAAIDSGAEDSGDRAAKDAADAPAPEKVAGDPGTEEGAGDSGTEDGAGDSGAEDGAGDSGAEDDAGDSGAEDDAGARGAAGSAGADSANANSGGAVSAGSEQGSALGSGSASGAGFGDDSSTGRSDENTGALNDRPSRGSPGSDQPATGIPVGGEQQFDPAELLLPLLLSNLPDTGSGDPDPDPYPEEDGEHGTDPGPGAQAPSVSPAPQQPGPTPWSRQSPVDQSPATEPPGQPAQNPPRSVVPSSPVGTRDEGKGVVYTHTGDNVTETVSASVAAAYDRAYENKSATDAKAAYAGTAAEWADEKALTQVDPNDLTSGDIITFDNGTALVRVQKAAGHPDGGTVDVIIEGELTPIAAVMADGAGELGGFAGFRRPPGIELPVSEEHGAGGAVPATDDRSGDTDLPG